MSYNLSSIRNQVIDDKLDDTSFDPSVVDRFINATQRDIFNTYELPFQEKVFSGALPISERIFEFPDDLQVMQAVVITAPDGTQKDITKAYMPYKDFIRSYPTPANNVPSSVVAWTSYAGRMYTGAPIDQSYTMDTFYLKTPDELEDDSDVPEVPEEFQEVLVLGAYKRVLERNEDFDLAAVVDTQYGRQLDKMVSRYGFRITGQPVIMRQPNVRPVRNMRQSRSYYA